MKTPKEENGCQYHLADKQLQLLQEKVDLDLAENARQKVCGRCGDTLHCDNYPRKPRGGPSHWNERYSFTCARNRHRVTPPSVRFLGRKVYVTTVIVLVSAMHHGLNPGSARILCQSLGVDRRTLEHWRQWWLEAFIESSFWKAARARFMPPVCEKTLPQSLCEAFEIDRRDRFLELLKFLSPITTTSIPLERLT